MHHVFRCCALSLILGAPVLGGCAAAVVGGAAIGADAAHDRRGFGTVFADRNIQLSAYGALNKDKELALRNHVSIVVYNGVMLMVGEVRTAELKARAERIVHGFNGVHRLVNDLDVREPEGFWARRRDSLLTARVKTALLDIRTTGFDPTRVNVTTAHRVVYLLGLVSHAEDDAITAIVRDVNGVERVVKVFEYTD
ncbi:MAG TPA: BON domain-containing protein [Rhodanobacteraceae bacterium]|nr:BON domain-containing protein [Rhodanobacteraceae bacterium]